MTTTLPTVGILTAREYAEKAAASAYKHIGNPQTSALVAIALALTKPTGPQVDTAPHTHPSGITVTPVTWNVELDSHSIGTVQGSGHRFLAFAPDDLSAVHHADSFDHALGVLLRVHREKSADQ